MQLLLTLSAQHVLGLAGCTSTRRSFRLAQGHGVYARAPCLPWSCVRYAGCIRAGGAPDIVAHVLQGCLSLVRLCGSEVDTLASCMGGVV